MTRGRHRQTEPSVSKEETKPLAPVLAYGTVRCLPTLPRSQTRSTRAGSLAGCRSPHGQPWPLLPAAAEAAGSPGCKASFQSLDEEAVFVFIPLTAGGCSYPKKWPPREMGHLLLAPLGHRHGATSWRLMDRGPGKQVRPWCLSASLYTSVPCRHSINTTTKVLL